MAILPVHPGPPHRFRFDCDPGNRILLLRFEGRISEDSVAEIYSLMDKYWAATKPWAGIVDGSGITEVALSPNFIRHLAAREPISDMVRAHRVLVVPTPFVFGLARMFQLVGEQVRPNLIVVHTMDEALKALGVQSPSFEPLAQDANSPGPC